jgi:fructose PTS system EIIA component
MTTIDDVISVELVDLELDAGDRFGAIEKLANLLAEQGRVSDLDAYVQAVRDREGETGGTGMESGIAIPHAKSAGVERASVAFGRAPDPIEFGDSDADLIFLIAAPEGADDLHVKLLSRLARRLVHESFRSALREAETPEDVVARLREEVDL